MIDFDRLEEDSSQESAVIPKDEDLGRLAKLVFEQQTLEREIERHEDEIKKLKERLEIVITKTIPEIFRELHMTSMGLDDGSELIVEKMIRASLSEERKAPACAWLRENNQDDLIKSEVKILFGRGEDSAKLKVIESLLEIAPGANWSQNETVPWNTLTAFVKEQMELGAELPKDLLGIFVQDIAKIKMAPKPRKKKA